MAYLSDTRILMCYLAFSPGFLTFPRRLREDKPRQLISHGENREKTTLKKTLKCNLPRMIKLTATASISVLNSD